MGRKTVLTSNSWGYTAGSNTFNSNLTSGILTGGRSLEYSVDPTLRQKVQIQFIDTDIADYNAIRIFLMRLYNGLYKAYAEQTFSPEKTAKLRGWAHSLGHLGTSEPQTVL